VVDPRHREVNALRAPVAVFAHASVAVVWMTTTYLAIP
jgi:hypothetical protein